MLKLPKEYGLSYVVGIYKEIALEKFKEDSREVQVLDTLIKIAKIIEDCPYSSDSNTITAVHALITMSMFHPKDSNSILMKIIEAGSEIMINESKELLKRFPKGGPGSEGGDQ